MPEFLKTMNQFNQRLLTHYPLLWNTRFVWIMAVNIFLHLLFFLSGFSSIKTDQMYRYGSVMSVSGSMYTMSILCSILVVASWLLFFLRNNAFKNFYRITQGYLAREFLLILITLFTSINFFQSYNYGIRLRVRTMTPVSRFESEINSINLAKAFLPTGSTVYFILNNCEGRKAPDAPYSVSMDEQPEDIHSMDSAKIREAMKRSDAFSYRNYCEDFLSYGYSGISNAESIGARINSLIRGYQRDSIIKLLRDFSAVCDRYGVKHSLDIDSLVSLIYRTPLNNISTMLPTEEYTYRPNGMERNSLFIELADLQSAYRFMYDCLPNESSYKEQMQQLVVEAYVALFISILLLCYRRFTRRVFLISIIGSIVWCIITGLVVAAAYRSDVALNNWGLLLFFGFGLAAWFTLRAGEARTTTGILLTWHALLAPFVMLFIMMLIDNYHEQRMQELRRFDPNAAHSAYPFSYWVSTHHVEISIANIIVVILYIAFLFNIWTRKWIVMAEE